MPLLSSTIFQPPLPPILLLLPPSSPFQWILRLALLALTLLTIPLILILVPLSLILLSASASAHIPALAALAPLPIHPHNRPGPHRSWAAALLRGWWVYTTSGVVWSITSLGAPPLASERRSRSMAQLAKGVLQWVGRTAEGWTGGQGVRPGELDVREERVEPVGEEWRRGVLRVGRDGEEGQVDAAQERILGFWLRNTLSTSTTPAPLATNPTPPRASTPTLVSIESHIPSSSATLTDRKVYLFLAGGGYVTGWPLVHPFLFSLARTFPPEPLSPDEQTASAPKSSRTTLPHRAIFSPDVRRSLSRAHAFPIPLMDALAAYVHLLRVGYTPEEIVVMGDSAGGGLAWSLVAYLAVLHAETQSNPEPNVEAGSEPATHSALTDDTNAQSGGAEAHRAAPVRPDQRLGLGIPGGLILISPWLALPPNLPTAHPFPDFLDTPQLLNAARCYLARFPVVPGRPDPFDSDLSLWTGALGRRVELVGEVVRAGLAGGAVRRLREWRASRSRDGGLLDDVARHTLGEGGWVGVDGKVPPAVEAGDAYGNGAAALLKWLDTTSFEAFSSHHPLVSPSTYLVPKPKPESSALWDGSEAHSSPSAPPASLSPSSAPVSASLFVSQICRILATNHTKMLVSAGTAEWFYPPAMALVRAAQDAGVEVETHREMGGFHVEACLVPAEIQGPGRRLVQAINGWA